MVDNYHLTRSGGRQETCIKVIEGIRVHYVTHGTGDARDEDLAVALLAGLGYVTVAPSELPVVTVPEGKKNPKLPPYSPAQFDTLTPAERANEYRTIAAQNLALAAWYDKKSARDEKLKDALVIELLQAAEALPTTRIHSIFDAHLLAENLIAKGWKK